jgi:hypothetical protein
VADQSTSNQGYGQQDPSDSADEHNARDFHILARLARVSTAKLVQVKAVDTSAKTVDVQIMVNQLDGQNNSTPHGTINAVPYLYFQCGNGAFIADPVVGDKGLMVCCDRDISAVVATKEIANPGSFRKLSAMDGIYVCGLPAINDAPSQFVKVTATGMELQDKSGNSLVSSSTGWAFTGPVMFNNVVTAAGNLQLGGNVLAENGSEYAGTFNTSGDVVAQGKSLATHEHDYLKPSSGGVVVTPTSPPI